MTLTGDVEEVEQMAIRATDRWLAPARGTVEQVMSYADDVGSIRRTFLRDYAEEMDRLCDKYGFDFALPMSHSAVETGHPSRGGGWLSAAWADWGNPIGLGITDGGLDIIVYQTSTDAARAHFVHLWLYVKGEIPPGHELQPWIPLDPRYDDAIRAGYAGIARTLADLQGRWWTNAGGTDAVVSRGNALFPGISDQPPAGTDGGQAPVATRPKILLIAGHRSHNDAGNPGEKARTPALALAYYETLTDAGYEVAWLQRDIDGDGDPDDTVGGLDTVSAKALQWGQRTPGQLVILDLHFEGAYARGHFAIVPDKAHLGTAVAVQQPANDNWADNPLDQQVGRLWAAAVRELTGLPLRSSGVREPGLMSETGTGVAGRYNARLATFAYTAPLRDHAVRLVLEHGSLLMPADVAIIDQPGFASRCAVAALRAIDAAYGIDAETPPAEEPEPTQPEEPAEKHTLPDGMTIQLARRLYGRYEAPWGKTYEFDPEKNAASQRWLARGKRAQGDGTDFSEGSWPKLVEVIRRGNQGDQGELYRWSNGAVYWSKPKPGK